MKLISLNIEGNLHLNRWIPWIEKQKPDVICLQEVYEDTFSMIKKTFGFYGEFAPSTIMPKEFQSSMVEGTSPLWGVALFSTRPIQVLDKSMYVGSPQDLTYKTHETCNRIVLVVKIFADGELPYTIATTHFTWSSNGENTEYQYQSWESLSCVLNKYPEILLCGDMNVPRGSALAKKIADSFVDCIPAKYDSSLDPMLHRVGHLKRMVDHLLSRGPIRCTDVYLQEGVSDHKAIVATVSHG